MKLQNGVKITLELPSFSLGIFKENHIITYRNKKILHRMALSLFVVFLLVSGCAFQPAITEPLIESQQFVDCGKALKPVFIDNRDDKLKNKKSSLKMGFPVPSACIFGDLFYDIPLNTIFEKLVITRFGSSETGYTTEFKLKEFYTSYKINPLVAIPAIGILAACGADLKWTGVLKVDVCLLDNENMFVLDKSYEMSFTEMRPPMENVKKASLAILQKLFSKFANELEVDVKRTRFPSLNTRDYEVIAP